MTHATHSIFQSSSARSAQPLGVRAATRPGDLRGVRGGEHLTGLHPTLRAKALRLYAECERAGVPVKFISGHRKMRTRKSRASWHNFGMAFDLNLVEHPDMKTAVSRYRRDKRRWAVVGRIGQSLNMIWGQAWRVEEIFHFEWHPGMPQGLRGANLRTLLAGAGSMAQRPANVWHHFHE